MSKRNRALAPAIAPSPKPATALPKLIAIREGDATALELRLNQRGELQKQLAQVNKSVDLIVADIAKDAGVIADDLSHRYQFAGREFIRIERPPAPDPPPDSIDPAE